MRELLILCLAGLSWLPASLVHAAQCEFFDATTGEIADGECSIAYDGDAEIITLGDRRTVFTLSKRQGQWAVGTLDGQPAMRYEKDRETFSYATRDLTRFIDRAGQ